MAVLEFNGYQVMRSLYEKNMNFYNSSELIELEPVFEANIEKKENSAVVFLNVSIGSTENNLSPFYVDISVKGSFEFHPEDDENNYGMDIFLEHNAVAILYPYIRALVSNVINSSNEFPGYNLPTINISEALKGSKD